VLSAFGEPHESRRGVHMLMAKVHPLTVAIPIFIQLSMPLPLLKPMVQSRRGGTQLMEAPFLLPYNKQPK
jgi:hypothetical protein